MKHWIKTLVCLVVLSGAFHAQAATEQPAVIPTAPVAYVFVSRPTHIDSFAVSSSGKLTAVPGSPFAGNSVYHMSVTSKYLFGAGDDQQSLITYSIASNGSLKQISSVDAKSYASTDNCCSLPQRLDATGTTLYNFVNDQGAQAQETFKIQSNGDLQFIGNAAGGTFNGQAAPGEIAVLGNNQFAYQTGCNDNDPNEQLTVGYKRESTGLLQSLGDVSMQLPEAKSGYVYCPYALASDASNHMAILMHLWHQENGGAVGPMVLASYTADAKGNLTTTSTSANMPSTTGDAGSVMSISASAKLVAVGGNGFQVFHFNGSAPATAYTGTLHASERFVQFGWDKSNHLFALSTDALHVYNATSTSITEAAGSPISIPEASSVIVLSLQ